MKLIGITGRLNAGKDSAAQAFIDAGYRRQSFADPLKDVVAYLADEDVSLYHDREAKEMPSPLLGMPRRKALQLMGTEGVRNIFGPDFWARRLLHTWEREGRPHTVVADVRFDNEAQAIRANGGIVVEVIRPDNDTSSFGIQGHASEAGVSWHLIDRIVVNGGTPEELHERCRELLKDLRGGQ